MVWGGDPWLLCIWAASIHPDEPLTETNSCSHSSTFKSFGRMIGWPTGGPHDQAIIFQLLSDFAQFMEGTYVAPAVHASVQFMDQDNQELIKGE